MARSPLGLNNRSRKLLNNVLQSLPFGGRSVLIACLVAATFITGIRKLGGLQRFELFIFDSLVRLQADERIDPRLVVIGVTESDIRAYGHPLSDEQIAKLLAIVQQHDPKVIGLDIYRNAAHPPGRNALFTQLAADNVIAITNVGTDATIDGIPPPNTVPWERVGFNDLGIDPDGVIRRGLLFVDSPQKPYYSFALRVALAYIPEAQATFRSDEDGLHLNGNRIHRLQSWSGGYETLDNGGYQTLLRFSNRHVPATQISVEEILKGQFDPSQLTDKIILIGSVAPSLKDEFYTPYSSTSRDNRFTMSGVVVHSQLVSQLLDIAEGKSAVYQFSPLWGELVWLIVWSALSGLLAWKIRRPEMLLLMGMLLLLLLVGVGAVLIAQLIWLPMFEPLLGVLFAGALVIAQKSIYRSTYDSLTDLPGREVFLLNIRRALCAQRANPIIVAFLDVDRFQTINKSLGHFAGDRVLIEIAQRLQKVLGNHGQIARVGGDEFAVLFYNSSQQQVKALLDTLRRVLASPLILGKHRFSITASVGLAVTTNYGQTPEELLRDAHTAMYRAKALKEVQYQVFSNDMREEAVARLTLESDLIKALENNEFSLFYQPIMSLNTGRIAGFEALVRWQQVGKGIISPNEFIPVVEETGMIIPLGEWILKTACQQVKTWKTRFPGFNLKMSINLSRRQFDQVDLAQRIESILAELSLSGECLQLEITESIIMRDVEAAHGLMQQLKALGIQLAIDDFGTGYSSLSQLHRFPMDTLKVDKSFVSSMEESCEDRDIVQTIISLGHKLNMNLVAEGIANAEQLSMLKQTRCHYGQGYYFSKPLPANEATEFLEKELSVRIGASSNV